MLLAGAGLLGGRLAFPLRLGGLARAIPLARGPGRAGLLGWRGQPLTGRDGGKR
jgi:hypothetical protein